MDHKSLVLRKKPERAEILFKSSEDNFKHTQFQHTHRTFFNPEEYLYRDHKSIRNPHAVTPEAFVQTKGFSQSPDVIHAKSQNLNFMQLLRMKYDLKTKPQRKKIELVGKSISSSIKIKERFAGNSPLISTTHIIYSNTGLPNKNGNYLVGIGDKYKFTQSFKGMSYKHLPNRKSSFKSITTKNLKIYHKDSQIVLNKHLPIPELASRNCSISGWD